jgi:hypothetical protein
MAAETALAMMITLASALADCGAVAVIVIADPSSTTDSMGVGGGSVPTKMVDTVGGGVKVRTEPGVTTG